MKKIFTLALISAFFAVSCSKQKTDTPLPGTLGIENLVVPEGFNWETSKDVDFSINISDSQFGEAVHVISVYDGNPAEGGILLSSGAATTNTAFKTKIYLAATQKEVYVVSTDPTNVSSTHIVQVSGDAVTVNLNKANAVSAITAKSKLMANGAAPLATVPDCNTGCTLTVNATSGNRIIENGQVACVTGSDISVDFTLRDGATVRICGKNVNVTGLTLEGSSKLIITKDATVTLSSLNFNSATAAVYNYGSMSVTNLPVAGIFFNQGTVAITNDLSMTDNSSFNNTGSITVGGNMNPSSGNEPVNNGSIVVKGTFQLNQRTFTNNCYLSANILIVNGSTNFKNYSLVKVAVGTTLNDNAEFGLYNGAMLTTGATMINGVFKDYGTTSLIKVKGTTSINNQGGISGTLQYCSETALTTNILSKITGGATNACGIYIAKTACNDEGNGKAPVLDTDGDGVPDSKDEYPKDPDKAFNNYYPSKAAEARATLVFEDKWPLKGDYDMNDIVISYRYKVVTNAQNKVVQVVGNYSLLAAGGDFQNGFGVEFPIKRSAVSKMTGATLEEGQTNAVAILFQNSREKLTNWNTVVGAATSAPATFTVEFEIAKADIPELNLFGVGVYNPFIWNNGIGKGRGNEIHLSGKKPTSLADLTLFGTRDDGSVPTADKYYVTAKGLPWALSIPTSPLNYPTEKTDITKAYLKLADWVQSGGTSFIDWYSNTNSGYRNTDNLYN